MLSDNTTGFIFTGDDTKRSDENPRKPYNEKMDNER
jgi:hypothetical protein